jgi:hypothetical protein
MSGRLDELAEMAADGLAREVPRAAVVRAAVSAWLATIDSADREKVIEAIRLAVVKRGRKPRS